jgi:rubrerythrin
MSTIENIKAAFAGESQANRKYSVFSEKAKAEGFNNVAKLYRAASEAEAIHAKRLLFVADMVGSTEENLAASINGETEEYTAMYPSFIKTANTENKGEAIKIFTHAMKAEEVHAGLYKEAAEMVKTGKDMEASAVFLCPVCGNIALNSAPDICPICNAPKRMFREIE